jgi:hypothetical protein
MDRMSADGNAARERVGWSELGRWLAPWLLGGLLAAIAVLGLLAASRAQDEGIYALGFATAGLALLALSWEVKSACDGGTAGLPPLLVEDGATLVVLVAVLAVLAVCGLLLAARSREAAIEVAGYALFGAGLLFAGFNLKHYFDWRERHPPG